MKLFGRSLFDWKKEPEYLWDFARWGLIKNSESNSEIALFVSNQVQELEGVKKPKKRGRKPMQLVLTPKAVYEAKSLNANDFKFGTDEEYLSATITECKKKQELLPKPPKGETYGATFHAGKEIASIIERLENRRKLSGVKAVVESYPHTTSELINDVMEHHKNLRFKPAAEFVPDFPTDAIKAMKEYDDMCMKVCGKKAVFYVIAQSKDFEKVAKRRDPILLAQSPFGFFWQILGAWDEEMMYLGDL